MQLSNVTSEDAVACAQLIRALQIARFDGLNGKDIEAYMMSKKWIADLGLQIASQLPGPHQRVVTPPAPIVPADTIRVRAMGPIGGQKIKKTRKK